MIGHVTLSLLKESLTDTAKEGKVALLFHFSREGDPVRTHIIEKIRGIERLIQGIDLLLAGGTSELAQEGIDAILESVDKAIPRCPELMQAALYMERAHFLEMKDRFQKLDDLLEVERPEPADTDRLLN